MSIATIEDPRGGISEAEWQTRVDLAACYQLAHLYGMAESIIYTHISARVPGPDDHFLLNPFGLMFDEVTASNLVKVDIDGDIIGEGEYGINPAGFVIHSCVHRERPEMACVIHTHTVAGTGVSAQAEGLLPITQEALTLHGKIAYHDYEGIALDPGEQRRLIADMGDCPILILRNHGLLTAGRSVAEAFTLMYFLELACRTQVAAQAGGSVIALDRAIGERVAGQMAGGLGAGYGTREFAALKRRLDRLGIAYAH